jgi:ribosomal protein S3
VLLLSFWFANSLVASRVASGLASSIHPTPSAVEFQKAMEADLGRAVKRRAMIREIQISGRMPAGGGAPTRD